VLDPCPVDSRVLGVAGAVFAVMIQGYYSDPSGVVTYGFDAIAVSLLAANNPLGVVPAALLFGGLDMLQIQFQTAGIELPNRLVNLFPYVAVVVVLTVWGSTRMPSAVGEPYDTEE